MKIKKSKRTLQKILKYIEVAIILHNLLIAHNDDDIPDDWYDWQDFSDIDDDARAQLPANDELNQAIPESMPNNTRRSQLTAYINEVYVI